MNEFDTYKSLVKIIEKYRLQNMTLASQLTKAMSQAFDASAIKAIASLKFDFPKITGLQTTLLDLSKQMSSPVVELTRLANISISRMLETVSPLNEVARQINSISQGWGKQLQLIHNSITASQIALYPHLARISEVTILAQASLSRFPWGEVGNTLKITNELKDTLSSSFLEFSRSYSALYRSFEEPASSVLLFPPIISELPSLEYFTGADLLESISVEVTESELAEEKQRVRSEILSETEDAIQTLLANLDVGLVKMLQGAGRAIDSNNADHVRHFTVSLRELFTKILHRLAPDDKVHEWSTSSEHFSNSRPTRKARLLYIYRNINHGPLNEFVERDIELLLDLMDIFQSGTHKVTTHYTQEQLSALKIKTESAIRFLLEVSGLTK